MRGMRRLFLTALIAWICTACTAGTAALRIDGHGKIALPSTLASDAHRPALPALAEQHTGDGADAFVRYYFETLNWAVATTDWSLAERITDPACSSCAVLRQTLTRISAADERIRHQRIVVDSAVIEYVRTSGHGQFGVDVAIRTTGTPTDSPDGAVRRLTAWLKWRGGRWTVSALERDE